MKFHGIYTALVTPFDSTGAIDWKSYRKLLESQIQASVSGVIPCGTTGESPTLDKEERRELLKIALEMTKGTSLQVIAGTGSNRTDHTIDESKAAQDLGAHAVLVVTPYYNKPSPAGLEAHFTAVADALSCPVVLYNVPGRTGVSLQASTIAALSRHKNIRALKEASGNLAFASEILTQVKDSGSEITMLSGDDPTFLSFLSVGGRGAISVASNVIPRQLVALQSAFDSGKFSAALEIHNTYFELFQNLFIESNPTPVKWVLSYLGLGTDHVRLPLVPPQTATQNRLKQTLDKVGLKSGAFR